MSPMEGVRIVDLHADLPLDVTRRRERGEHQVLERLHLAKLRKGNVGTVIVPIWVESNYKPAGALKRGLHIADALLQDLGESPSFRLALNHQDLVDGEHQGKIGLIMGAEGGEIIEDDLGVLRDFHRLGLRCFGFMWNQRNLLADGWDHVNDERGLTDLGKQVIEELERLRVVVDLAHMAPKSFWGVMDVARRPLIVSHTATPRHKSLRSMTDDQLRAVRDNGGIVGIFAVNTGTDTVTMPDLEAYCDHIEYAAKLIGPDHVGLGPDFYDYFLDDLRTEYPTENFQLVKGIEDHSKLGAVIQELSQRGLSDQEIRLIAGENFIRLFREVVG
jgi:membrane dipeptidase